MVIHGPKIGGRKISDVSFAEIRQINAGRNDSHRIPELDEALTIMPHNTWLNVHLKDYDDPRLAELVARTIVRHKRKHQALLSGKRTNSDAARRVDREILLNSIERPGGYHQGDFTDFVKVSIDYGYPFVQSRTLQNSRRDVAALKRAGIRINYCCTNDPEMLSTLYEAGIDFVMVDNVKTMMKAARKLGIEPIKPVYLENGR